MSGGFFKVTKLRNRSRSGSSLLPSNSMSSASSSNLNALGTAMGAGMLASPGNRVEIGASRCVTVVPGRNVWIVLGS